MKGLTYVGNGNAVQSSFKYLSHTNLAVSSTASTTAPIDSKMILISLTVGAHVRIGTGSATVTDFVLPSGVWPISIIKLSTVSVLQLTGSVAGQASIIIPEE